LSDSEIFNDTDHRPVSLRQLSFLSTMILIKRKDVLLLRCAARVLISFICFIGLGAVGGYTVKSEQSEHFARIVPCVCMCV